MHDALKALADAADQALRQRAADQGLDRYRDRTYREGDAAWPAKPPAFNVKELGAALLRYAESLGSTDWLPMGAPGESFEKRRERVEKMCYDLLPQRGARPRSVPNDFRRVWGLVEVLSYWAGRTEDVETWRELHNRAAAKPEAVRTARTGSGGPPAQPETGRAAEEMVISGEPRQAAPAGPPDGGPEPGSNGLRLSPLPPAWTPSDPGSPQDHVAPPPFAPRRRVLALLAGVAICAALGLGASGRFAAPPLDATSMSSPTSPDSPAWGEEPATASAAGSAPIATPTSDTGTVLASTPAIQHPGDFVTTPPAVTPASPSVVPSAPSQRPPAATVPSSYRPSAKVLFPVPGAGVPHLVEVRGTAALLPDRQLWLILKTPDDPRYHVMTREPVTVTAGGGFSVIVGIGRGVCDIGRPVTLHVVMSPSAGLIPTQARLLAPDDYLHLTSWPLDVVQLADPVTFALGSYAGSPDTCP